MYNFSVVSRYVDSGIIINLVKNTVSTYEIFKRMNFLSLGNDLLIWQIVGNVITVYVTIVLDSNRPGYWSIILIQASELLSKML